MLHVIAHQNFLVPLSRHSSGKYAVWKPVPVGREAFIYTATKLEPVSTHILVQNTQDGIMYDNNGGTVLAVAGNDYCIVAGSTRLSTGYSILTRDRSMITPVSEKVVIAAAGFDADASTLKKVIQQRNIKYQNAHKKPMSVTAAAQLVGNTLYMRRFFPYYSFTLVCGIDAEGKGAVYSYDAVGSHERVGYGCQGSGSDLIQPVLDNQLKASSPLVLPQENWMSSLPQDEAVDLVKAAFVSAGERDIYTGDKVEILVMTSSGTRTEFLELKKD